MPEAPQQGPLRVGWVVYGPLDQVSGGYIYDRLVVEGLRRLGDEVEVISLSAGARELPSWPLGLHAVIADELCFRELPRMFAALPAATRRVLLIHHLSAWEHQPGTERARLLALEREAIGLAEACVATSRTTAQRLLREGLVGDVQVAEPGADRFAEYCAEPLAPSRSALSLLFVGSLQPRKQVLELVRSFLELDAPGAQLLLVGAASEPEYARSLRELLARRDHAGSVHWLGPLPSAALVEQLRRADALVLPSALEGYGMVLSEALWCGVPILAARTGAAAELSELTSAALLFEPGDRATLDLALSRFLREADLRLRLRSAAALARTHLPRWQDTVHRVRATLRGAR